MKKKIGLVIILILELLIFILYAVAKVSTSLAGIFPFNVATYIGSGIMVGMCGFSSFLHITQALGGRDVIGGLIALVITNVLFIIVYYVIFYFLGKIIAKKGEAKRKELVPNYELTNLERERFDPDNYRGGFPWARVISLIIPLFVIFLFIIARFDKTICQENSSLISGIVNIFPNFESFFDELFRVGTPAAGSSHVFWSTMIMGPYINAMKFLGAFSWVEYIFITLWSLFLLAVWYGFFSLINRIFKNKRAERKARVACQNYIVKMEKKEYRLRKNYKEDTSVKADEFLNFIEHDVNDNAEAIATITPENELEDDTSLKDKQAYMEEIGEGVHEVEGNNEVVPEDYKPHTEREVRYITDEDVDIILEEEPMVEIIGDEDNVENNEANKDNVFFEKYVAEENPTLDENLVSKDVSKYVENVMVEKEEIPEKPVEEINPNSEKKVPFFLLRKNANKNRTSGKEVKVPSFKQIDEVITNKDDPTLTNKETKEGKKEIPAAFLNRNKGVKKVGKETKVPAFKKEETKEVKTTKKVPTGLTNKKSTNAKPHKETKVPSFKEANKVAAPAVQNLGAEEKVPSFKELDLKEDAEFELKAKNKKIPAAFLNKKNTPKKSGKETKVPAFKKEETKEVKTTKKVPLGFGNKKVAKPGKETKIPPFKKEESKVANKKESSNAQKMAALRNAKKNNAKKSKEVKVPSNKKAK